MRKQLDDIISKNGDLSRANSDLRHKITEFEYTVKEQKEKMGRQRSQIEHLTKIRQKQEEAVNHVEVCIVYCHQALHCHKFCILGTIELELHKGLKS